MADRCLIISSSKRVRYVRVQLQVLRRRERLCRDFALRHAEINPVIFRTYLIRGDGLQAIDGHIIAPVKNIGVKSSKIGMESVQAVPYFFEVTDDKIRSISLISRTAVCESEFAAETGTLEIGIWVINWIGRNETPTVAAIASSAIPL